jgi:lactocepin
MKFKFKRSVVLSLVSVLTFSSAASAAVNPVQTSSDSASKVGRDAYTSGLKKLELDKSHDPAETVRVILELEGEAPIVHAKNEGVRYKDLSESTKETLEDEVVEEQAEVLAEIQAQGINLEVENTFNTVFNGISGEVKYGEIERLEALPNVAAVHIVNEYKRPEVTPQMVTSGDLVEASQAWGSAYGFKGEGMIVGVIDTGVDPSHEAMVLSEGTTPALDTAAVTALKTEHTLPGEYYTEKVPYGYNYMDQNSEILDLGPDASMHGMHVAGTVGANGEDVKGIAPEAQILALKVFGNDPEFASTYGDIYVKAIDDAIKLGADVINMSLGSTASFVNAEDPEQKAVADAVASGVMMAISAGNSAQFGNGAGNPLASNPDIGVVGAPGLSSDSLQVASIENSHIQLDEMSITFNDNTKANVAYKTQSTPLPLDVFGNATLDLVYVGDGSPEQYVGKNVAGKLVFVVRPGSFNYAMIQKQAEAAGAAGVVVRGAVAHGDYVSMALDSPKLPMVTLSIPDGNLLETQAKAGKTMKLSFTGNTKTVKNATGGQMSAFTSWGVTPNLDFKPEITAPGGQIYSTFNNNTYGLMSGTSMAAPHVAGGSALVLQRVAEEDFGLSAKNKARVLMAKNILMNTAKPVVEPNGVSLYSPRRQGAGLMQLNSALHTPVVVTEKTKGEAKVALKEITGNEATFTLVATNYSDESVSYRVTGNAQTDGLLANGIQNSLSSVAIAGAEVRVDGQVEKLVTVPANDSLELEVTVDLTDVNYATKFPNGYFAEGFIKFENVDFVDVAYPELNLPYVGFKGDWNAAPILDPMFYDDEISFYGVAGMYGSDGYALGYNPAFDLDPDEMEAGEYDYDYLAISPNGDGYQDDIIPLISFLRNATKVEYSILDEDQNVLRTLRTQNLVRKHYYDGGRGAYRQFSSLYVWDGKVKNEVTPDGKYYYEIKSTLDYTGKEPQKKLIPVVVDTVKPTVTASYNNASDTLTLNGADTNGSGVSYYVIVVGTKQYVVKGTETSYKFTKAPAPGSTIKVYAVDYAGNEAEATVVGAEDETIPSIYVTTPASYGVVDSNSVVVAGYVNDASGKPSVFKVAGNNVPLTLNTTTGNYEFSTTLELEDGIHDIRIEGVDKVGNAIDFLHKNVFVDSTPSEIAVTGLPTNNVVAFGGANPVVDITVTDNFEDVRFFIDGSEEFYNEITEPYGMNEFTKEVSDYELVLKPGHNQFIFEAEDLAGHVTTKVVNIYKLTSATDTAPTGEIAITGLTITPNAIVSNNRPATISATASESITWDVKVEDEDGVEYALATHTGASYSATFTPDEFAASGTYTLTVNGENAQGVKAVEQTVEFVVYNKPTIVKAVTVTDAAGVAKTTFAANEAVKIKANVQNISPDAVSPLVIIKVKDSTGKVVHLGFLEVDSLNANAANGFGIELNNLARGTYKVDVLVWDGWNTPAALAEKAENAATFTVQ